MNYAETLNNLAFQAFKASQGYAEIHHNTYAALTQFGRGIGLYQALENLIGSDHPDVKQLKSLKQVTEEMVNNLLQEAM